MRLIISLPVYNESTILEQSVRTVHAWSLEHLNNFDWEIIIADNGSTDDTVTKAEILSKTLSRVSVFHTDEKGRGQVIRRLWLSQSADIYTYMDVDLAVDLKAFLPLIESLANDEADVAIGSRFLPEAKVERSAVREFTSRAYNFLVHIFLKLRVADTQCGFKGINKKTAETALIETQDPGWFWDTELLAFAQHQGLHIKEIPVEWVETRTAGRKSKVALVHTIKNYLWNLWHLRKKLHSSQKKSNSWDLFLAAVIFIISFGTSTVLADNQSLDRYYDQGNYLLTAKLIAQGLIPHHNFAVGHLAFYPWLLSLLFRLGATMPIVRFFHFGVIAASLVVLFFLIRKFSRTSIALLVLGFFWVSPLWLMHSGLVLLDHPALLLLSLSILIITKYHSIRGAIAGGLLLGFAIITKDTIFIPIAAVALVILLTKTSLLFKKNTWLFVIGALVPFLLYLLLLGPVAVWNDVFAFHLGQQTIMNLDERLHAFFGILFLGTPFLFLALLAAAAFWHNQHKTIRIAAHAIPLYLFLLIIQRSIYYHHSILLFPALLLVLAVAAASIPRDVLRRISIACFLIALLVGGTLHNEWYRSDTVSQNNLVSFLQTVHQPIFTWTPFWVLKANGQVAPWYYMATSDMAYKRGLTPAEWQTLFEKSPYIVVDKRTKKELPASTLLFLKKNYVPVFVNQDFTVYKNPVIKNIGKTALN